MANIPLDPEVEKFVNELLANNIRGPQDYIISPLQHYIDYINLVAKRLNEIEPNFSLTQGALKALNPIGYPKTYNPATPLLPADGFSTDNLDGELMFQIRKKQDNLKQYAEQQKNNLNNLNIFDDDHLKDDYVLIDLEAPHTTGKHGMKTQTVLNGVQYDVPDYENLFNKRKVGPDFGSGEKGESFFKPKQETILRRTSRRRRVIDEIDSFINKEDYESGFVNVSDLDLDIPDIDLYIPFFFEDLRKQGRRIYFRAFLTQFRESIAPEWSQEKYFGRIDPIAIYKNTSRSFSIGFTVAAMSPAGFSAMWKKINNLCKMVYLTFKNGVMTKSPILRLRIGDVMCDGSGLGLPGYISSPLELDYTDSPWEIEEFSGPTSKPAAGTEVGKAPMIIKVSFSYQVIHETNPSIDSEYNFDSLNFRRMGTLEDVFSGIEPIDEESTNNEENS